MKGDFLKRLKHTRAISIFLFILKALVDRVDWLWSACVFPQENGEKLARSSPAAPAIAFLRILAAFTAVAANTLSLSQIEADSTRADRGYPF